MILSVVIAAFAVVRQTRSALIACEHTTLNANSDSLAGHEGFSGLSCKHAHVNSRHGVLGIIVVMNSNDSIAIKNNHPKSATVKRATYRIFLLNTIPLSG
jgi:hypothetical protein